MATFASAGLLGVANGRPSPVAELITDHDLSQIPHLASTHPGATKREELRARYTKENAENEKKRLHITLNEWARIFAALRTCTMESDPVLSRELEQVCSLDKTFPPLGGRALHAQGQSN